MTFWIDDKRGALVDWITQKWVIVTGRPFSFEEFPWLGAPMGKPTGIGFNFYENFSEENGLIIDRAENEKGLISDFSQLNSPSFVAANVSSHVIDFYERTSGYDMHAWSEWCSAFKPFGFALSYLFSKRLQQLNVPLSPLDTAEGVKSKILRLKDPVSGEIKYTAWVRELIKTNNVIYAGNYSTVYLPNYGGVCVKVAFPLPNGNALVFMKPEALPDGSFLITSAGKKFGDPGFYFTLCDRKGRYFARYVPSFQESIRVYQTAQQELHADHILKLFGLKVLHIHYKLSKKIKNM